MTDITGTSGADTLNGTSGADVIYGLGGNDSINGQDGADTVYAGDGDDTLTTSIGPTDTLYGGNGNDHFFASRTAIMYGEAGTDTFTLLSTGHQSRILDFQVGAAGDRLDLASFADVNTAWNGVGNPFALGYLTLLQVGEDVFIGYDVDGGGDQTFPFLYLMGVDLLALEAVNFVGASPILDRSDTAGADSLTGTAAMEVFHLGAGNDSVDGGRGTDTAVYAGAMAGYRVAFVGGAWVVTDIDTGHGDDGVDTLRNIEELRFADGIIHLEPGLAPSGTFNPADAYSYTGSGAVAAAPAGGFVTAWASGNQALLRLYDADGDAIGPAIDAFGIPGSGSLAIDHFSDGSFVIVGQQLLGGGYAPLARLFGADGTPQGPAFQISNGAVPNPYDFKVEVLADDSFVVAWESGPNGDRNIFARHYAADGTALGGVLDLGDYGSGQRAFDLVALSDGGFFLVRMLGGAVTGQAYAADGSAIGAPVAFNSTAGGEFGGVALDRLADGRLIVAYADDHAIVGRIFDPATSTLSAEFALSTTDMGPRMPDVAALDDGGFVVVWEANGFAGRYAFAQRFGADAARIGEEIIVANGPAQTAPSVAALPGGSWTAIWQDGSGASSHVSATVYGPPEADAMAILNGTPGDDSLSTGIGPTIIHGLGGNDSIFDSWFSADHGDELHGDDGNDQIFAQGGNDRLFGEAGDDILSGGLDADRLDGGDGKDRLTDGSAGGDTLIGGAGDDEIIVSHPATGMIGGSVTTILGGTGNDRISLVYSRTPQTLVDAGEGDDRLVLTRLGGTASLTLGAGNDTVELTRDFGGWPFTGVHITDFGAGDRLAGLSEFLFFAIGPWDGVANPFATDQLRLRQSGADTLLERNFLGTGDDWTTILTFDNVSAPSLTAAQLDGFDPTGAAAAAQTIDGTAAGEQLYAGQGDDVVHGNDGDDTLTGNAGNDSLYGGAGNDTMIGGVGTDLLDGGSGNDTFEVTANGADTVIGGDGDDYLNYRRNDRNFFGYPIATGTSHVDMGAGNDRLDIRNSDGELIANAGAGNDVIYSNGWGYRLTLGTGADTIEIGGTAGTLTITDFNPLEDRFSSIGGMLRQWGSFTGDPYLTNHIRLVQQGADTAVQISPFIATPFTETAILLLGVDARSLNATNFGGYAPDGIWNFGTGGIDSIAGGAGNDRLFGQAGNDTIYGGAGTDNIQGGDGDDYLYGESGSDIILGGAGNDWIYGDFGPSGQGSDQIDAGAGDDTVYLGAGDIGEGGAGTDTLFIDLFNTTQGMTIDLTNLWTGGAGIVGSGSVTGFERLGSVSGSNAADTITVGTGGIVINGMSPPYVNGMGGDDVLTGGGDRDGLSGGDGDDRLYGLGGDDQLMGLDDDDYIEGGLGDDSINGGLGADVLIGGAGSDRYFYSDGAFPSADQIVELAGDSGTDRITINPYADPVGDAAFAGIRNVEEIELITLVDGAGPEFVLGAQFQAAGFTTLIASADIDASQVTAGINILVTRPNIRPLTITGGSGNDSFHFAPMTMPPFVHDYTLDGGGGIDTLYLDHASDAAALTAVGASLNIAGFEKFVLGGGTDAIAVAGRDDISGVREQYSFALTNALVAAGTAFTVDATALRTNILYNLGNDGEIGGTGGNADLVGSDRLILDGSSLTADRSLIVLSGAGDDTLTGGAGADSLTGGGGNDRIDGAGGDDQLFGGDGNDNLTGEGGADRIVIAGGGATIVADGGSGDDTITLGAFAGTATLTLGIGQDVLAFAGFIPGGAVTVTDFQAGAGGDRLEWTDFLAGWLTGWDGIANPFGAGYLRAIQSGADALVQIDRDGASGPGAFATFITLHNVNVAAINAFNLDGIERPNEAPVIGNLGDVVHFTEQGAKVRLDGDSFVLNVSDPDSLDFDGGSLRVAITGNCVAGEDVLIVNTTFGVAISGGNVSVLGVLVGTVSGSATDLLFSFNSAATPARIFSILRSFDYDNTNLVTPSTLTRTITWTLTDGDGTAFGGHDTATATSQVTVSQVNDIPQLTEATNFTVTFTEDTAGVGLMSGAVLSDGEASAGFAGGSLNLAVTGTGGAIVLQGGSAFRAVDAGGGQVDLVHGETSTLIGRIAGLGTASVTVDTLTAAATQAMINDLIDEFAFRIAGDNPLDQNQVATLTFNDGGNGQGMSGISVNRTQSIHIQPINDAPDIAGLQGDSAAFTEGAAPVALDVGGDALVTDADSPAFWSGSLRVAITAGKMAGEDVLGIANGGNVAVFGTTPGSAITIDGVWIGTIASGGTGRDGEDLVINLHSGATAAQVGALVHALTYANSNQGDPSEGARAITISLADGDGIANGGADTAIATTIVNVTGTEDPAVARDDSLLVGEATLLTGSLFADHGAGTDFDPDGQAIAIAAVEGSAAGLGRQIVLPSGALLIVNADGTFSYDPNHMFDALPAAGSGAAVTSAVDTFSYTLAGGGSATATVRISGVDSNDTLFGTSGADILNGGLGNDTYLIDDAGDRVVEAAGAGRDVVYTRGNYSLTAGSEIEVLSTLSQAGTDPIVIVGNGFNQVIYGNAGANYLDGGSGNDTLVGFGGDDAFVVDDVNDYVAEVVGGGNDIVYVRGSFSLGAGQEIETLSALSQVGTAPIVIVGNDFNQVIYGNAGANYLDGGSGNDTLVGFGGDDAYVVDDVNDYVAEVVGGGNDIVYVRGSFSLGAGQEIETLSAFSQVGTAPIVIVGNNFDQVIYGNAGANYLDGGGGNDTLVGFGGDDAFVVDDVNDYVAEVVGGGNDIIYVRGSFSLGAGQEIETLSALSQVGTASIVIIGNDFNQVIYGNAGANYLDGGSGNDTLVGFGGDDAYVVDDVNDYVAEVVGGGNDIVYVRGSFSLGAGQEIETLSALSQVGTDPIVIVGNGFNQAIYGNAGANYLDGGGGTDLLQGFGGNDTYVVDSLDDYVVEAAGQGNDVVYARSSYALAAGQEIEVLSAISTAGTTAMNLTGNELANVIYGNNGANVLNGGAGADYLEGFGGADSFQFTTALGGGNVDQIAGFVSGTDKIVLDDAVFTQLGLGALPASVFTTGAAATNEDQRIIYDSATGNLYYDSDGNGAAAAVLFANFLGHPPLAASDFLVI